MSLVIPAPASEHAAESNTAFKAIMSFIDDLISLCITHNGDATVRKAILQYRRNVSETISLHKNLISILRFVQEHLDDNPQKLYSATVEQLTEELVTLKGLIRSQCEQVTTIQGFIMSLPDGDAAKFRGAISMKVNLELVVFEVDIAALIIEFVQALAKGEKKRLETICLQLVNLIDKLDDNVTGLLNHSEVLLKKLRLALKGEISIPAMRAALEEVIDYSQKIVEVCSF